MHPVHGDVNMQVVGVGMDRGGVLVTLEAEALHGVPGYVEHRFIGQALPLLQAHQEVINGVFDAGVQGRYRLHFSGGGVDV